MAGQDDMDRFFLWHLEEMGVARFTVSGYEVTHESPLWDDAAAAAPVTVALIDTGIDVNHPNLDAATAGQLQIDFGPGLRGVRYLEEADGPASGAGLAARALPPALPATEVAALLGALELAGGDEDDQALRALFLGTLTADLPVGPVPDRSQAWPPFHRVPVDDPSTYFGAHGTACAGLVAGRPPRAPEDRFGAIAYLGVNPHCRLLSVATPYGHEIIPVIQALLLAHRAGAQVILMPRGVPDPQAREAALAGSPQVTRIDSSAPEVAGARTQAGDHANLARLKRHQEIFERLVVYLSSRCYLVLAAGNDGWAEDLSYPAELRDRSEAAGLIVVGARNSEGAVSSYSNGHAREDLLWMVSDDGFIFDQSGVNFDPDSFVGDEIRTPADLAVQAPFPYGILATDPRRSYGYATSRHLDPPDADKGHETTGLYTIFGGTSAASALAAGMIALLLQAGRIQPGLSLRALRAEIARYYPHAAG